MPKLGADLAATSVSGLSSGAYMAGQIEVAHAKDIVGAGIVAGGPYACAESAASRLFPSGRRLWLQNAQQALNQCMKTSSGKPDAKKLAERAKELAEDGEIDPLAGSRRRQRLSLFRQQGRHGRRVRVVEAAKSLYEKTRRRSGANIALVEGEGGHAFITTHGGAACDITGTPYVSELRLRPGQRHPRLDLRPAGRAVASAVRASSLLFDQGAFAEPGDGFADEGVVYVPKSCTEQPGCRVHIALHGCEQSREAVGDAFIKTAAMPRWPTPTGSSSCSRKRRRARVNPNGCWDWWGYTDLDYLGKDAPQIKAIWAMVEQLAQAP